VMIGPDTDSFKQDGGRSDVINWLADFMDATIKSELNIFAITDHEYIEVNTTNILDPRELDIEFNITIPYVDVCQKHSPKSQIWAGESGPHNAGSPPCDHSSMRWANFADGIWYLDNMAITALSGYDVFCRQDFIGADY